MPEPSAASPLPKRVLHVMNSATGGAALSTLDLIAAFHARGIDSVVVCHPAGQRSDFERIQDAVHGRVLFRPLYWGNRKIRSPLWKRPAIELYQLWRTGAVVGSSRATADFAARHDVDLIHTNTILTPEGGRAARRLDLPHVWHVRELVGRGLPYRFYRSDAALGRYLERQATLVVANSQVTASKLRGFVSSDVLRVVPNGIDVGRFSAPKRREGTRVVVGMVANMASWKRHDIFVETAAAVARSLPLEFRVYGQVPENSHPLHESIARRGLQDRFRFMGFVPNEPQIMSEIDILMHVSELESFGRVLVEAMAAGLPVVAVRGGGAAEIVIDGETGLLAAPNSVSELTAHLERLATDAELRRRLGEAGRRRVETEFSLERCADRIQAVYIEALRRHGSRSSRS